MTMTPTQYIWRNGSLIPWHEATTHVLAHGLHYGSSVFEGIRAYCVDTSATFFRLQDHLQRLVESASIYRMQLRHSIHELSQACHEVVRVNGLGSAYVRPIVYRGAGSLSLAPGDATPIDVAIAAIEWGAYLGDDALRNGVDACISSWRRPSSECLPMQAKAGGHYLNAQLIAQEARDNGFGEGIALNTQGHVSEGSGENLFLVRKGELFTPPLGASILNGITRDTVITLARSEGVNLVECSIPREALYTADEIFMTGTAAEITPVRSVDRISIGGGRPGRITRLLQDRFFGLFDGATKDEWGWLEPVADAPTVLVTESVA